MTPRPKPPVNFSRLLPDMDDPDLIVFIRDREGRYVWTNEAHDRLQPFKLDEVRGKTNRELFGERLAESWERADEMTWATPLDKPTVLEETFFDKRYRRWRKYISTKFIISVDGTQYIVGLSTEVKKKQQEEQERRMAELRARLINEIRRNRGTDGAPIPGSSGGEY